MIGQKTEELSGSHLPANGDVLPLMMFYNAEKKLPVKAAAASAMAKVIEIWDQARIPYQRIDSGVRILMKLYDDYEKLKTFRSLGAYHHARWLAKAIYCIKICLFKQQFSITDKKKSKM